jgi:excinuclease ABC subunit C
VSSRRRTPDIPPDAPPIVAAALASAPDAHLPALKALVRAGAEDRPGVYRMLGPDGDILYVGKSKQVRTRLLSYFRCVYPDDKGARILRDAVHIEWEYTPSEFAALLLELRQIKRWRPRYNVAMKRDVRHFAFVKLTRGEAPKLQVVKGTTGSADGGIWYGPFSGPRHVTEAIRELNDALGLRDCANDVPMRFADQQELFDARALPVLASPRTPRCLRHEVRKCLGPCVAACTVDEYRARAVLARAFLDGADDTPLATLRLEMERSAEAMRFERAAQLRDKVQRLEALQAQFDRLRFGVEQLSFAYRVPGHDAADRIYLVRRGRVRAEVDVPATDAAAAALLDHARTIYAPRERGGSAIPTHEVDELLLLTSWFRLRPDELARTVGPTALLRGQLGLLAA